MIRFRAISANSSRLGRVHHPAGPREYGATLSGEPLIATIPCEVTHIGWGANVSLYGRVESIRNGRHRRERAVWEKAVRALRREVVVYVRMEQREYYGRDVWTAVSVRTEPTA